MILPVTVIITVFNRTDYLAYAVKSVLAQTLPPLEIIVKDDSSSKAIKAICDSFERPEIQYRANFVRLGVVLSLASAINEAKGKYISILNDDDVFEPEFLEKVIAPLEENQNRILAFSDYWILSENGRIDKQKTDESTIRYGRSILPKGEVTDFAEFILKKNGVPLAMASIFRKDALSLDLLVKDVAGAYDFWISCLLAATGRPAYYIPERLTGYRVHGAMETGRKAPDKNMNMVFIFNKLIELNFFPRFKKFLQEKQGQVLCNVGADNLFFDRTIVARKYFLESLKANWRRKAFIGLLATYLPKKLRVEWIIKLFIKRYALA